MKEIRKILSEKNQNRGRGWFGSASFEVAEARAKQHIDPGRWNELGWMEKHEVIALQRALNTMEAYEHDIAFPE